MNPNQTKEDPTSITPTEFYKALADDIRLKTLLLIAVEKEICVCELMTALDQESQPKISRHLALLKKTGVLSYRKHKQWVFYALNPALPLWMQSIISSTVKWNLSYIELELQRLNKIGDRPARQAKCDN